MENKPKYNFLSFLGIGIIIMTIIFITAGCSGKEERIIREMPEIPMVWIDAGTFMMGSPDGTGGINGSVAEVDRQINEVLHQVTLTKGFYMSKYPVTQELYGAVMETNPSFHQGENLPEGLENGDKLPVEKITWYEAIEFCNKLSEKEGLTPVYTIDKENMDPNNRSSSDELKWIVTWNKDANGYRLPTEAEWEYACRAGTTTPFNTGDIITTEQANFNGSVAYSNSPKGEFRETLTEVDMFPPNAWGLYGMHGNVYDYCWDWFSDHYYEEEYNGIDPMGPLTGVHHVIRGGSANSLGRHIRSAYRLFLLPVYWHTETGIRLVRSGDNEETVLSHEPEGLNAGQE